jgi:hypothetical protein
MWCGLCAWQHPKTRYAVANVDGMPAKLVIFLSWLLPDRTSDKQWRP